MSQISVRLAASVARQVAKATPQVCHLLKSAFSNFTGAFKYIK